MGDISQIEGNKLVKNAFTLVELSIVLVIIGFLIGGISAGNILINAAKLRSVITDYQKYQSIFSAFVSKYNRTPGDMDFAYSLWGAKCAASSSICNGDNSGDIDFNTDVNINEISQAWNHLYLAGMLDMYVPPITNIQSTLGVTAPASKMEGAGYILRTVSQFPGSVALSLAANDVTPTYPLLGSSLLPEQAFIIDQKIDDGMVDSSGNFIGGITGILKAAEGTSSSAGTCLNSSTGVYNISQTIKRCRLYFKLIYN